MVTARRVVPDEMRAADRAAPVDVAEGDRGEQEHERRGVRHLLWKTDERGHDRAADADYDHQQDDRQLSSRSAR